MKFSLKSFTSWFNKATSVNTNNIQAGMEDPMATTSGSENISPEGSASQDPMGGDAAVLGARKGQINNQHKAD
ncbi:MAG: hypothetical protein AAFY71_01240 [Bacteroidota bacterium]